MKEAMHPQWYFQLRKLSYCQSHIDDIRWKKPCLFLKLWGMVAKCFWYASGRLSRRHCHTLRSHCITRSKDLSTVFSPAPLDTVLWLHTENTTVFFRAHSVP
ncbi:PREDICTED: uncharacterized protein LOC104803278 isoform X2 [Tarenaya hassleriana]|uniref:uncharacterized protein LOC104803278 isoform X2 n=1 Tax=Tarenaya hassleriana TaxID=28532 RepID=UPI00053C430A|nr:PREDICTED: uncharacterized protein LOC104803278 isoform X2 [Tarenaya hassleriana]